MSKELIFKLPNVDDLEISIDNHLCGHMYNQEFKIPLPEGDWMIISTNYYNVVKLIKFDNE